MQMWPLVTVVEQPCTAEAPFPGSSVQSHPGNRSVCETHCRGVPGIATVLFRLSPAKGCMAVWLCASLAWIRCEHLCLFAALLGSPHPTLLPALASRKSWMVPPLPPALCPAEALLPHPPSPQGLMLDCSVRRGHLWVCCFAWVKRAHSFFPFLSSHSLLTPRGQVSWNLHLVWDVMLHVLWGPPQPGPGCLASLVAEGLGPASPSPMDRLRKEALALTVSR